MQATVSEANNLQVSLYFKLDLSSKVSPIQRIERQAACQQTLHWALIFPNLCCHQSVCTSLEKKYVLQNLLVHQPWKLKILEMEFGQILCWNFACYSQGFNLALQAASPKPARLTNPIVVSIWVTL